MVDYFFELFLNLTENILVEVDKQLYVHIFALLFLLVFCLSMMSAVCFLTKSLRNGSTLVFSFRLGRMVFFF